MKHALTIPAIILLFFLTLSCASESGSSGGSGGGDAGDYVDLTSYQWHLVNTGQCAFASDCGEASEDINQESTYSEGYDGSNVIVAVVDSGLEVGHIDLDDNMIPNESYDFTDGDNDPTPSGSGGDHGTSVAGLIGSEDNSIGPRGVAPGVGLKGFNFLSAPSQTFPVYVDALGASTADPHASDVDIFNMSFGYSNNDDFLIDSTFESHLRWAMVNLRSGYGAIYVKSAGNGFGDFGNATCTSANSAGVSCQNVNMDPENTVPWIITVGALNAHGERSSYSTAGSAIWISAPGGESGYDESYGWSSSNPPETFQPAMVTTDFSGCSRGYSQSPDFSAANRFEDNSNGKNENCDFTSTFNGTSSAAPVASGAIALLLEQEPTLTWREIKHILATTARKVDPTHDGVTITVNGDNYQANLGWVTNDASYDFHNYYGFGAIDVDAAMAMAKNYTLGTESRLGSSLPTEASADSGVLALTIPDASADGVSDTLAINTNLFVEAVQVAVSVTHSYSGDIGIELTSPSGTKSILLNAVNGFYASDDLNAMVLLSNAFYGEDSSGDWTLTAVDGELAYPGTLTRWTLTVFGR